VPVTSATTTVIWLHSVGFANGVGSERAEREKEGGKKIKIKK